MRIFGLRPMSTFDRMENLVKIISEHTRTAAEISGGSKVVKTAAKNEKIGNIIDKQA